MLVHKVYGRFAPRQIERDHWERMATEMDEQRAAEGVQIAG